MYIAKGTDKRRGKNLKPSLQSTITRKTIQSACKKENSINVIPISICIRLIQMKLSFLYIKMIKYQQFYYSTSNYYYNILYKGIIIYNFQWMKMKPN